MVPTQALINARQLKSTAGNILHLHVRMHGQENCGLLFTSPIKHNTFQAVVGQQRPRTKKRDARAN